MFTREFVGEEVNSLETKENGRLRIAIAVSPDGFVHPGHFAHAPRFRVYEYAFDEGPPRLIEERSNPLGEMPDVEDPEEVRRHFEKLGIGAHGKSKYDYLRENVLPDVHVVVCYDACPTSVRVFEDSGVRVLFTPPATAEEVVDYIAGNPSEFKRLLEEEEPTGDEGDYYTHHSCGCGYH